MNPVAKARLEEHYNTAGYPTTYFDGGDSVYAGAPSNDYAFRRNIVACGSRPVAPLSLVASVEFIDTTNLHIRVVVANEVPANTAPATPAMFSGVHDGRTGESYQFTARGSDPEYDSLRYQFDWGDGVASGWLGPYGNGVAAAASHTWTDDGTYPVRVRTKDPWEKTTGWSGTWLVHMSSSCCAGQMRGNIDNSADLLVTMGDLTVMIDHLFISLTPLSCVDAGNVDESADNLVTMGDLTVMIDHLFITLSPLTPCP